MVRREERLRVEAYRSRSSRFRHPVLANSKISRRSFRSKCSLQYFPKCNCFYSTCSTTMRTRWFDWAFASACWSNCGNYRKFWIFKFVFDSRRKDFFFIFVVFFQRLSDEKWFGLIPKYRYVYKDSYTATATSEYDRVRLLRRKKTKISIFFV